jgi:hypothetical protein
LRQLGELYDRQGLQLDLRQRLELNVETAPIALKVKQASEVEIRQVVECEVWQLGNRLCRPLPCGVRGLGRALRRRGSSAVRRDAAASLPCVMVLKFRAPAYAGIVAPARGKERILRNPHYPGSAGAVERQAGRVLMAQCRITASSPPHCRQGIDNAGYRRSTR